MSTHAIIKLKIICPVTGKEVTPKIIKQNNLKTIEVIPEHDGWERNEWDTLYQTRLTADFKCCSCGGYHFIEVDLAVGYVHDEKETLFTEV